MNSEIIARLEQSLIQEDSLGDELNLRLDSPELSLHERELLQRFPRSSVMMGHMIVPGLGPDGVPSSMNADTYRLLRTGDYPGGVPFEGVVVTDDLSGMRGILDYAPTRDAVARAIGSGADQALWSSGADLPGIIDHIVWCVHNGYIPEARVDEAATRAQQQLIDVGL